MEPEVKAEEPKVDPDHPPPGQRDDYQDRGPLTDEQKAAVMKAHNNLGLLAARMGQWQDSLRNFTSTLTYCPKNIIAHYGLGTIYYESVPNKKRAIFHYEMLLQLKPNFEKSEEVRKRLLELTW